MRVLDWWWVTILLATLAVAAPSSEENAGSSLQESIREAEEKEMAEVKKIHHRVVRQLLDGFRLENTFRDGISALENVDDMLRTTIPNLDRFNCLERLMCSVMSGGASPVTESPVSPIASALGQVFDPTFQQGVIQNPQTFSQELINNPLLQQLFSQGQGTQALQGLLSQISPVQQQSPVQNAAFQQGFPPPSPAFQQGFPPPNAAFQQGFPPPNAAFHQGFSHNPAFGAPHPPPPPPPPPGFHPQLGFPNFRENPETEGTQRRSSVPRPQRRRKPPKRREGNGFFNFLGRLGLGRRKKRDLLDDILGGFSSQGFMGILDRMMDQYSFYPYTHAAFMGYTGSSERCEKLYPSCPSTAEQLVDVFNNIHRHYPNGIPYKERLPWPLNILLP